MCGAKQSISPPRESRKCFLLSESTLLDRLRLSNELHFVFIFPFFVTQGHSVSSLCQENKPRLFFLYIWAGFAFVSSITNHIHQASHIYWESRNNNLVSEYELMFPHARGDFLKMRKVCELTAINGLWNIYDGKMSERDEDMERWSGSERESFIWGGFRSCPLSTFSHTQSFLSISGRRQVGLFL